MSAPALTVTRLAGALGAEISGLDLSRSLRQDDLAALRSAWLAHGEIGKVLPDVMSGAMAPKQALDDAVKRGDEQLRRFQQANKGAN